MFKTADELQKFLEWAQAKMIKQVKIGDIEVEFSELAYIPDDPLSGLKELSSGKSTLTDESIKQEDEGGEDPDLFWSAR